MTYPGMKDLKLKEGNIYDRSQPGKIGYSLKDEDLSDMETYLPEDMMRGELDLPEVSELDVVRHYTRLSTYNFSLDGGFYPLGSCTMKYNPKINEKVARFHGFLSIHPETPDYLAQGSLKLMYNLQEIISEVGGFVQTTLNPSAGAHGEYVGLAIMHKYFMKRGESKRRKVIIPDSAHGTNPASCTLNGFDVVVIESNEHGKIDLVKLKELLDDETAGIMLTNPNTLGVFETDILEITKMVHDAGGLVYGDGANMNALLGVVRPGDMGIDVMHFNLHKTFSTPHGGGGPGSGPVGVVASLAEFLPNPLVVKKGDFYATANGENSIGMIRSFYGNFGVNVRAYTYSWSCVRP